MQSRLAELKRQQQEKKPAAADDSDSDSSDGAPAQATKGSKSRRKSTTKNSDSSSLSGEDRDVEMGQMNPEERAQEEDLKEFFGEVQKVKRELTKIKANVRNIRELYDKQLTSVSQALDNTDEQEASKELEKLIDETNFASQSITNRLKRIAEENKKIPEEERGFASGRIRINMHGTLTKQFMDLMKEYQTLQTDYKNIHRENVERRYMMVKPDATAEEIELAMESGTGTEVFAEEILGTRSAKARDALAYVENKHRDIQRLEASIRELHQLFVDMAILVEAQGELIDHIEANLESARDYTRKGVKELHKANEHQKSGRKNMILLIVCVLILFVIIAVVLGIAVPG
jgi:syntaxin 1B/2/3